MIRWCTINIHSCKHFDKNTAETLFIAYTIEMFKFNALSRFNIALFIYHHMVIYAKARAFKAKAKKFGLKGKAKD